MNSARQILRYSIPGSIFLIHAVACYLIYQRIQGVPIVDASLPIREGIGGLIAILATIPLGFVLYQTYYFLYQPLIRPWPFRWDGRLVRNDRGGEILESLEAEQIAEFKAVFDCEVRIGERHVVVPEDGGLVAKLMHRTGIQEIAGPFKKLPMEGKARQLAYEDLWYTNWDVLRAVVDIAGSLPEGEQVKSEYTSLSDIYHSLGAARTAVIAAWSTVCIVVLFHFSRFVDHLPESFVGLVAISALSAGVYLVLHTARGRTWRSAAASLRLGLRWFHAERKARLSQPVE